MPEIILAVVMTACATFFLASGVAGFMGKNLNPVERILFYVAALLFVLPGSMYDIVGIVLGVVLIAWCIIRGKQEKKLAAA